MLLTQWGLNPQPPDHQSNTHPTEPPRLATRSYYHSNIVHMGVKGGVGVGGCGEVGWESCNHLFLFVKLVLTLCDLYVHFNVSKWQILKVVSFFYLFFWKKKGSTLPLNLMKQGDHPHFCKSINILTAVNVLTFCTPNFWQSAYANSADPDQAAPKGAVWPESTLFVIPLKTLRNHCIKNKFRQKSMDFFFVILVHLPYSMLHFTALVSD